MYVLKNEQKIYKRYKKTGRIRMEYVYLVWKNKMWPSKGEPKTLEVILPGRPSNIGHELANKRRISGWNASILVNNKTKQKPTDKPGSKVEMLELAHSFLY